MDTLDLNDRRPGQTLEPLIDTFAHDEGAWEPARVALDNAAAEADRYHSRQRGEAVGPTAASQVRDEINDVMRQQFGDRNTGGTVGILQRRLTELLRQGTEAELINVKLPDLKPLQEIGGAVLVKAFEEAKGQLSRNLENRNK